MITAEFLEAAGRMVGVVVKGHAGFAEYGRDVVCASVTSAVQMAANGISEILKVPCSVSAAENCVQVILTDASGTGAKDTAGWAAVQFLQALYLQLRILEEDYRDCVRVCLKTVE